VDVEHLAQQPITLVTPKMIMEEFVEIMAWYMIGVAQWIQSNVPQHPESACVTP
jgi:hypothetical protein